jgi:hypothetical protein
MSLAVVVAFIAGSVVTARLSAFADVAPSAQCPQDAPSTLRSSQDKPVNVTRESCAADVAVYVDGSITTPAETRSWVAGYMQDVWTYMRHTYGSCAVPRALPGPSGPNCEQFGAPDKSLLVVLHELPGSMAGTSKMRFEPLWGFRNVIEVSAGTWNSSSTTLLSGFVHEVCHQVEDAGQGLHGSPAAQVWEDSRWADFCVYDFFAGTGRTALAEEVFDSFSSGTHQNPRGAVDAHWFRDWFFPLWRDHGKATVMQRFFELLSQYFPTKAENSGDNQKYARSMNTGEFVHFLSGAAGVDLSGRAAMAFNTGFTRSEFTQARADFPQVTYAAAACQSDGWACTPLRVSYPGRQSFDQSDHSSRLTTTGQQPGESVRYAASGLPAGVTIDAATGAFTGHPTVLGSGMATVTATSASGNTGTTSFQWTAVDYFGLLTTAYGTCMNIDNSNTANGTAVQGMTCWSPRTDGQSWTIANGRIAAMGKCLTPPSDPATGTVVISDCDNSSRQQWRVDKNSGTIRNAATGLCLTEPGRKSRLTLAICIGTSNQEWSLPGTPATVPTPHDAPNPPRSSTVDYFGLLTTTYGTCMDIDNSNTANGTAVQGMTCWNPRTDGQSWTIANGRIAAMGKCLTPPSDPATGTAVISDCDNNSRQQWTIDKNAGTIRNADTGLCLTEPRDVDRLTLTTCMGISNQEWSFPGTPATVPTAHNAPDPPRSSAVDYFGLLTTAYGTCMDVDNSSTTNGTAVQGATCRSPRAGSQSWTVTNGQIVAGSKCLTPPSDPTKTVVISDCDNTPRQRWTIDRKDGTIRNPATGLCLTAPGRTDRLTLTTCASTSNQQWSFPGTPASVPTPHDVPDPPKSPTP